MVCPPTGLIRPKVGRQAFAYTLLGAWYIKPLLVSCEPTAGGQLAQSTKVHDETGTRYVSDPFISKVTNQNKSRTLFVQIWDEARFLSFTFRCQAMLFDGGCSDEQLCEEKMLRKPEKNFRLRAP